MCFTFYLSRMYLKQKQQLIIFECKEPNYFTNGQLPNTLMATMAYQTNRVLVAKQNRNRSIDRIHPLIDPSLWL